MSGFTNKPKILRGAFLEWGLSLPPLIVLFQFNPVELQRSRSLSFRAQNETVTGQAPAFGGDEARSTEMQRPRALRSMHTDLDDLTRIREEQIVEIQEETISFELRLDATDALNDKNVIAGEFGIAPQLSTLEMMTLPKSEGLLGEALGSLLGGSEGFSFTQSENPPMVLFIWGVQRVLPVNITSLAITETEFDTWLNPTRATVGVNLTVVEGANTFYSYSKAAKEVMSVLNLANVVTDIVVP